jgi:arylsulfatase A
LGTYGSRFYKTPRINSLARAGIQFQKCFSTPLCTPSRVELLTGKYTHRNYVSFGSLPKTARTFVNKLKQAGYTTFTTGKWQLSSGGGQFPTETGFAQYCVTPSPFASVGTFPPGARGYYWFPQINLNDRWVVTRSTDYGPELNVRYLLEFMEENQNRPFFAQYPMHLPHAPFDAPPNAPDPTLRDDPSVFPQMVAYLDRQVGQILDKINQLNLGSKTIVIFTSDNGTPPEIVSPFMGRQVRGGKGLLKDVGTNVPLIVSWPGQITANTKTEQLVDFTDFYPTLAEIAGLAVTPAEGIDGVSFLPLLRGQTTTSKGFAISFFARNPEDARTFWVRNNRWKLYEVGNLFDMIADPNERNPIRANNDSPVSGRARTKLTGIANDFDLRIL